MSDDKKLRIRPEQEGTRVALFDLEADIMDLVWARDWEEFSVRDVHDVLEEERGLAYTTVMTTVKRLFDKELLDRHREGRKYIYEPRLTRAAFYKKVAAEVMASFPVEGRQTAMSLLVDQISEADSTDLDELEALIARRREELDE
jgi:predicted transcriptional regulator